MKKIILCVAVLVMLVGCGTKYDEAEIVNDDFANGYFVVIKKWGKGINIKLYMRSTQMLNILFIKLHMA